MAGTLRFVGMDVHARSTHAAAIDVMSDEPTRVRFGPGIDEPLAWLASLISRAITSCPSDATIGTTSARRSLRSFAIRTRG
jgi:hypothetical protein